MPKSKLRKDHKKRKSLRYQIKRTEKNKIFKEFERDIRAKAKSEEE
ncbi:MAG: hypothetical protein KDH96_09790 [Candidatus Riesia sp.]|nr:hypothetical protein [Candidatus Riesia sp.]